MSTILHTWCGLSVSLECMSETCCTPLAGNAVRKNYAKKSPSAHHRTTLSGYIFATKARIDSRKKLIKQQYLPTCPHNMVNFGPLAAEICWRVWGTPQISTGFAFWQRYCMAVKKWALAKLCGIKQRAPPIFGRAAITLGIGPHF